MKQTLKILFFVVIVTIIINLLITKKAKSDVEEVVVPAPVVWVDPLTHPQRVWLGALEWCESKGNPEAINKVDKDGTPSYWWYQFKPSTFKGFGVKYGLIAKETTLAQVAVLMKDYGLTINIMEHMVLDPDITPKQWRYSLFPGCTTKLGTPPKLSPKQ